MRAPFRRCSSRCDGLSSPRARGYASRMIRCLLILLALVPLVAWAQGEAESLPQRLDRWESEAKAIERRLEFDPPRSEEIEPLRTQIGDQLELVPQTRAEVVAALAPLRDQRAALGDPPPADATGAAEAPQIADERRRLETEIAALETYAKRIDQAEARARGIETSLVNLSRDRFREQLRDRGPSLALEPETWPRALAAIQRTASGIALETTTRIANLTLDLETVGRFALPLLLLLGGVGIGLKLRTLALRWLLAQVTDATGLSRRVSVGAGVTLVRLVLPVWAVAMIFTGVWLTGLLGARGGLLLEGLVDAAIVMIGAYALGAAYYAPNAPALRLSTLSNSEARAAHLWLVVLAGIVGLDRVFIQQSDGLGMAVEGLTLINSGLLVAGGVALWRFSGFLRRPAEAPETPAQPREEEDRDEAVGAASGRALLGGAQIVARLAAVAAPALAILGYFAASRYAFYPLVFSGALICSGLLLFHIVKAFVDGQPTNGEGRPGRLRLLPMLLGLVLTSGAVPVLALIWGAALSDLEVIWRQILEGFRIGDVVIVPADFLLFLIVLTLGWVLTGQAKKVLKSSILPVTGLDTGGRDAVAAGAGYLGLVVTVLVAISATGADLSNLAIVAGALSVGIGFGLQNIVNNFVSGIILLIERPIKAGDWIELPSGMGYVKTVNVRSTAVETFDRATLFVPNSQLISENVINWTHSNLHGRIICKVGVEYGSDPRKVERVLLEIARAHPLMLRRPAPFVLFRGFGADSLDFEIRGILRDVNWILNVQSDIYFEIAKRFAEEDIGIPFRQADISIKNADEIGAALRGAIEETKRTMPPPEGHARGPLHEEPARDPDADGPGDR